MNDAFAHERLHVYGKSLDFVAAASVFTAHWDNNQAVTDQLARASDSLVLNLAEAARLLSSPGNQIDESLSSIVLNIAEGNGRYSELDHHRFLDFASSAAVKSAAYLDLAMQKGVLAPTVCGPAKDLLRRVVAMLSRM